MTTATTTSNVVERIMSRVVVGYGGACWVWIGKIGVGGYGIIAYQGRQVVTHRLLYTMLRGEVPAQLVLDHLCRNRACCNPDHLEVVTRGENVLRGVSIPATRARQESCVHGHPFDADNTHVQPGVGRTCRTCKRLAQRARYQADPEKAARIRREYRQCAGSEIA